MNCVFSYKGNLLTEEELKDVIKNEIAELKPNPVTFSNRKVLKAEESTFDTKDPVSSDFYSNFVSEASAQQKEVYTRLINMFQLIELRNETYFQKLMNKAFKRVHDYLRETYPEDEFEGDQEKYEINREYGHQLDSLLSYIVNNKKPNFDEALSFIDSERIERNNKRSQKFDTLYSKGALEQAFVTMFNFVNANRKAGNLVLSQVRLASYDKEVAGTADIIIIKPSGSIDIVDLKTSVYPFIKDFKKGDINNNYSKDYTVKDRNGNTIIKGVSRKKQHSRQLSAYKGMLIDNLFGSNINTYVFGMYITPNEKGEIDVVENEGNNKFNLIELQQSDAEIEYFGGQQSGKIIKFNDLINRMITLLQEKISFIEDRVYQGDEAELKKDEVALLNNFISKIGQLREIEAIIQFTNMIHKELMSENGYFNNFLNIKNSLEKEANLSTGDMSKYITDLNYYYKYAVINLPYISNLSTTLREALGDRVEEDSEYQKILEIESHLLQIERQYNSNIIPLMAKSLYNSLSASDNTKYMDDQKKRLDMLKTRIKAVEDDPKISDKKKIKLLQKLNNEYEKIDLRVGLTEQNLVNALKGIHNADESMLERMFMSAIRSRDLGVSAFTKMLSDRIEQARQQLITFKQEKSKEYKELFGKLNRSSTDPDKANKGIYEKIKIFNGNKIVEKYAFVQKTDITKFNTEFFEIKERAAELRKENKRKEANTLISAFLSAALTMKEDAVENVMKVYEDYVSGKLPEERFNNMMQSWFYSESDWISMRMGNISENEYALELYNIFIANPEAVLNYNLKNSLLELDKVKYRNKNYDDLYDNEDKPKNDLGNYHKFLLDIYLNSQSRIPEIERLGYIIPSVSISGQNRLLRGAKNYGKNFVKNLTTFTEEDYAQSGVGRTEGIIPINYTWDIDINDVSLDLFSSVMMFENSVSNYEVASKTEEESKAMLNIYNDRNVQKISRSGVKTYNRFANKVGLKELDVDESAINTYRHLKAFIDTVIYGKSDVGVGSDNKQWGKVINNTSKFMSLTQIGGKVLLSITNSLAANINLFIESASGQYFSMKDYAYAKKEFVIEGVKMLNDLNNISPTSFLGQLNELYDTLQGEFKDQYGRSITSKGLKKLLTIEIWYAGMKIGELEAQTVLLISLLKNKKVKIEGKEISLYEAYKKNFYEKKTLELDNVEKDFEGNYDRPLQGVMHRLNKDLNGIYNTFDQGTAQRDAVGRLTVMYRKFILPGFQRRYGNYRYDIESGDSYEGYHRTMFNMAFGSLRDNTDTVKSPADFITNTIKGLGMALKVFNPSEEMKKKYSPTELANARRSVTEISLVMALTLLTALLFGGDDDDDKEFKKKHMYSRYILMRLASETRYFLWMNDTYRSFRTPMAAWGLVDNLIKFMTQLTTSPLETYKVNPPGIWEKGDSKLLVKFANLFGAKFQDMNPEAAIKNIERTQ